MPILILITFLPLIEIIGFIAIGGEVGLWNSFLVILTTGLTGVGVMKFTALDALETIREEMRARQSDTENTKDSKLPKRALASALLWVAGLLLVIPGFISDIVGALLVLPPLRLWSAGKLMDKYRLSGMMFGTKTYTKKQTLDNEQVIDGEYREL